MSGPTGVLGLIGVIGMAVIVLVAGVNGWMRWQRSRDREPPVPDDSVEATKSYRLLLAAAAWSSGSARDWDHSVRPVLADLVDLAVAERHRDRDPRAAARELLGEPLWALVDRDAERSDDRNAPGPGRDTLLTILDRVEGHR
jgi:hypothetical protein